MPHAVSIPSSGFQALILCGPGLDLSTFTANSEEFPKALVPIANRPMVWYPLDWCYRMGITDIHLITPPSSAKAIEAALAQNPHLTSLPLPRANVLAPQALEQTSGTADIFRLPEVRAAIAGDFLILPCDLVCELAGEFLIETWMTLQGGVGGVSSSHVDYGGPLMGIGGEKGGRRGGLGVWYQTKGKDDSSGGEPDFVITVPLEKPLVKPPQESLRADVSNLVYSCPISTIKELVEDENNKKDFRVRGALLKKHGMMRMLSTYRDAHIYLFPRWILDMVDKNEAMESIAEDVVGFWAKAGWQDGLGEKMGLAEIFNDSNERPGDHSSQSTELEDEMDILSMSTTQLSKPAPDLESTNAPARPTAPFIVPPILAYVQAPKPGAPLIRRVDTTPLLLSVSLKLAKLESVDEVGRIASSPLAHQHKVAHPSGIAQRSTVSKPDCLLAENVTVEEKCVVKESVIGANCQIKSGARLTRCLLMDGAVVGEKCQLTGCILGRRSQIGQGAVLKDCEVQEGFMVPEKKEAKDETFMIGLGEDETGFEDDLYSASEADIEREED